MRVAFPFCPDEKRRRSTSADSVDRICELCGWPQSFGAVNRVSVEMEVGDVLGDNAAVVVDEATADIRSARLLALAALIIYIAALFLPLWVSLGRWENAFPSVVHARLTFGFLIHNFTVPSIIAAGLLIMSRGRLSLAAGVFLGAGVFVILDGVARPFYAGFSARPLILMCIEFLVGGLLLLGSSRILAHRLPTVPPPPS
jgi:hypothetical protein